MYDECVWRYVRGDVLEVIVTGFDNFGYVGIMVDVVVFNRTTEFNRVHFHANINYEGYLLEISKDKILSYVETFRICR